MWLVLALSFLGSISISCVNVDGVVGHSREDFRYIESCSFSLLLVLLLWQGSRDSCQRPLSCGSTAVVKSFEIDYLQRLKSWVIWLSNIIRQAFITLCSFVDLVKLFYQLRLNILRKINLCVASARRHSTSACLATVATCVKNTFLFLARVKADGKSSASLLFFHRS